MQTATGVTPARPSISRRDRRAAAGSAASRLALHPVVGALSPTRAQDFLNCPLQYRYRAIDRLPERPGEAAARGTLVHSVLEQLFDLDADERTLERAVASLQDCWEQLITNEPALAWVFHPELPFDPESPPEPPSSDVVAQWVRQAEPLLANYFALEDPSRLAPAAREFRMEVQLEGLPLRGFIDRVDVAADGRIRLVDYKTGRAPSPAFEHKAWFQMRFYALGVWRLKGRIPALLQLMYLRDGQVLRYEPDEADLVAFEHKVRAIWQSISDAADAGQWPPRESKLCGWCSFHDHCPSKGGVVLELPVHALPIVDLPEPTVDLR